MLDGQACNEPQRGNAHRLDHAMSHVPHSLHLKLACASDRPAKLEFAKLITVNLNNKFRELQDLLEAINQQNVAVGMPINTSKTKMISAYILDK